MAFHKYGATVKFPRNEHVEIHVRPLTLNADAPAQNHVEAVEIREYIVSGETYGHGLVLPRASVRDLLVALNKVIE